MAPLTLDDLLPLEEYMVKRREFFDSHCRYLDRYRRVRIGPRLTLVFENRQTLWFRVQEIARVARLADAETLQQELNLFNSLLPGLNQLQAALLIEIDDPSKIAAELSAWRNIDGADLRLRLGERSYPATLITCRPEDRCAGTSHWVQFHLDDAARAILASAQQQAFVEFGNASRNFYRHQSAPMSDDIRQSLLDDLKLSDRDAHKARARSA
ncbi:MAG: DUF3501 family protein [Planctomycetes bacterium]|nr:DUF3501 family protein [Planctomycetota bacterium]